jgi:hypothetical protein
LKIDEGPSASSGSGKYMGGSSTSSEVLLVGLRGWIEGSGIDGPVALRVLGTVEGDEV